MARSSVKPILVIRSKVESSHIFKTSLLRILSKASKKDFGGLNTYIKVTSAHTKKTKTNECSKKAN